jgi:hypothetical protein
MLLTAQDRIIKVAGHFRNVVQPGSVCSTTKDEPDLSWILLVERRPVLFWRSLRSVQRAKSRLIKVHMYMCLSNQGFADL